MTNDIGDSFKPTGAWNDTSPFISNLEEMLRTFLTSPIPPPSLSPENQIGLRKLLQDHFPSLYWMERQQSNDTAP